MNYFYGTIALLMIGCGKSNKSESDATQTSQEVVVEETVAEKPIEVVIPESLSGEWILLLKQSDTSNYEIMNPCNGSAGMLAISSDIIVSSGQEAASFKVELLNSNTIQIQGGYSFKYIINNDPNFLNIISINDFPTSNLFGNFDRVSFDSLLAFTGAKDTLHFIKRPDNWREFLAEKGINQVYLPCDEDMFDEY